MRSNFFKLNGDKSEYLIFGSAKNWNKLNVRSVHIDQASVSRASHARNVGVIFDSNFTPEAHINKLCASQIVPFSWIHREISRPTRNCNVTPRYGNILLYGLPKKLGSKLQRVQNAAARLVKLTSRRTHITPIHKELHWLPISQRIEFIFSLLFIVPYTVMPQIIWRPC